MDWQDKYLCPLVERERFKFREIIKIIKRFFILLIHAVSFHKVPKEPKQELPNFTSEDEVTALSTCKEFYQKSNERIEKLEEKSLKLLTYVTALFAIISFAFINTTITSVKVILLISMLLLLLSIIISFRCVNIKSRKAFFITDVYDFKYDPPKENFNKMHIAKKLLNSSIYNHNVADNTADILKAARYILTLAIIICAIGLVIGINGFFDNNSKENTVIIENQIDLSPIANQISETNTSLDQIYTYIDEIDTNIFTKQIEDLKTEIQVINDKLLDICNELKTITTCNNQEQY